MKRPRSKQLSYVGHPEARYDHVRKFGEISLKASQVLRDEIRLRNRALVQRHTQNRLDNCVARVLVSIRIESLEPASVISRTRIEVRKRGNNRLI